MTFRWGTWGGIYLQRDGPELRQFSRYWIRAQTKQTKKATTTKTNRKNLWGPETSMLAVFFGWIHRLFTSSRDPKTVTCICCSNTITNNECELNIPCSQTGQRQTYYILISHAKLPHFNTVWEYDYSLTPGKGMSLLHVFQIQKEHKLCREALSTVIQRFNNVQKLNMPLKTTKEFLNFHLTYLPRNTLLIFISLYYLLHLL